MASVLPDVCPVPDCTLVLHPPPSLTRDPRLPCFLLCSRPGFAGRGRPATMHGLGSPGAVRERDER